MVAGLLEEVVWTANSQAQSCALEPFQPRLIPHSCHWDTQVDVEMHCTVHIINLINIAKEHVLML